MMTSRAEHRLVLREDNVIERLANIGYDLGLLDEACWTRLSKILERRDAYTHLLKSTKIFPNRATQEKLVKMGTKPLLKPSSLAELLRRPEIVYEDLSIFLDQNECEYNIANPVEIEIKYEGYIRREKEIIRQAEKLENLLIPSDMDFRSVRGLSGEEIEKLSEIRPRTLGQAQRISGVNPSAVQAMLVFLKGKNCHIGDMINRV